MHIESFSGFSFERLAPKAPVFLVTCPKMACALLSAEPDGPRAFAGEVWDRFGALLILNSRHGVSLGEIEADDGPALPNVAFRRVRARLLEDTDIQVDTANAADLAARQLLHRSTIVLQVNGDEPQARERSTRADNGYLAIPASRSNRIMLAALARSVVTEMDLRTEAWSSRVAGFI